MQYDLAIERLYNILLTGDRNAARTFCNNLRTRDTSCEEIAHNVYWPIVDMLFQQRRADQITTLAFNYATRLIRSIVDGWRVGYTQETRNDRSVLIYCGEGEVEDLSAQLASDLIEASGWTVTFAGSGIATDEVIAEAGERRPDALVIWAPMGVNAPVIRELICTLRERGANQNLPVVCGGGVFNRAPGLAEEIGADAVASSPATLIEALAKFDSNAVKTRRTSKTTQTNGGAKLRAARMRAVA